MTPTRSAGAGEVARIRSREPTSRWAQRGRSAGSHAVRRQRAETWRVARAVRTAPVSQERGQPPGSDQPGCRLEGSTNCRGAGGWGAETGRSPLSLSRPSPRPRNSWRASAGTQAAVCAAMVRAESAPGSCDIGAGAGRDFRQDSESAPCCGPAALCGAMECDPRGEDLRREIPGIGAPRNARSSDTAKLPGAWLCVGSSRFPCPGNWGPQPTSTLLSEVAISRA